jgi:aspartate/methionine/tyrosine aminotransferase
MNESNRVNRVQPPIIPIVAEMIRQTPGTISLGQGIVHYGPPPEALARINLMEQMPELHRYQAVHGMTELIAEIERKLQDENDININQGNRVMVTAGGNMAFINALLAIADPGDEIILQTPYYFNHEMAIVLANANAVLVPTDENSQLRPEAIRRAITSRTRAIVTISPNNPTGAVYSESALGEVNEICRDHGIYHINDEAYEHFTFDGTSHFSPASIEGSEAWTISLFSFSKSYGMASWRLGYMVVPAHLVTPVNKIQDTILICPPVVTQLVAVGALQRGGDYLRERLVRLAEVREIARQELAGLGAVGHLTPSAGALYFWLRINTEMTPLELVSRLIREHRVAAIPGSAFGDSAGCSLRISYGSLEADRVCEGVGRLVRGIEEIIAG